MQSNEMRLLLEIIAGRPMQRATTTLPGKTPLFRRKSLEG